MSREEDLNNVKQDGLALQYVEEQTKEICLAAVKQNGLALEYVKTQTEEICLEAVKQEGYALEYVEEQTEEICLEAICETCDAIQFVEEQTEEMCIKAVNCDGLLLKYCLLTDDVCFEAVKQDGLALEYLSNNIRNAFCEAYCSWQEISLEAVKQNGLAVEFFTDEYDSPYSTYKYDYDKVKEICLAAVSQHDGALSLIPQGFVNICTDALKQKYKNDGGLDNVQVSLSMRRREQRWNENWEGIAYE